MIRTRVALALVLLAVGIGIAPSNATAKGPDLSGAYEGDLLGNGAVLAHATAVLAGERRHLRGTVELTEGFAAPVAFEVKGKRRGRRVKLRGRAADGRRLKWHGRLQADGMLAGRAKLKGTAPRIVGALDFVRAGFCEDEFATHVFAGVLVPVCAQCHVEGGVAAATQLRVTATDVTATRTSVAGLVDFVDPPASVILHKPLGELAHGGGVQLTADGPEFEILRQWVDLVVNGTCGDDPGGGDKTGEELWTGVNADGVQGPNIRCQSAGDFREKVQLGDAGMPSFPELDVQTIDGLAAFVHAAFCALDG